MSARGINISLGTDSAASNNDLDMLAEMRTAALLAKSVARDATALPAWQALEMATIHGARALGIDTITGSLTPGKGADIVAIDMNHFATQPVYDPVSQLVYSAARGQISDVWVDGKQVVLDHDLSPLIPKASSPGRQPGEIKFQANTMSDSRNSGNVDPAELAKFEALAARWWTRIVSFDPCMISTRYGLISSTSAHRSTAYGYWMSAAVAAC